MDFAHYHCASAAGMVTVPDVRIAQDLAGECKSVTACTEIHCLKFCPDSACQQMTGTEDADPRCWNCGGWYVPAEECEWVVDGLAREVIAMCEEILAS